MSSLAILVAGTSVWAIDRGQALSAHLDLPTATDPATDFELLVVVTDEQVELQQPGERVRPVFVDFTSAEFTRREEGTGRRSLIARAVGFKGESLQVVDATAGLGRDAMLLALLGCEVTAVEQNGVVHALFADGLRRAESDPRFGDAIRRLRLVEGDGVEFLGRAERGPDVVYLDPMFPARKKSALPGRELQALVRVLGHGEPADAEALLAAALDSGTPRVVVKRSDNGAPLEGPSGRGPSLHFSGRTVRFDVYLGSGKRRVDRPSGTSVGA